MKTMQDWFAEYNVSHQNPTNKKIHFICVPAIFFAVLGILQSLSIPFLGSILPVGLAFWANFSTVLIIFGLLFYARLSVIIALGMLFFCAVCLATFYSLASAGISVFWTSVIVFIVAWIGQFYGHNIEGRKPSFLKDLQFLLIGPAWVMGFYSEK